MCCTGTLSDLIYTFSIITPAIRPSNPIKAQANSMEAGKSYTFIIAHVMYPIYYCELY